MRAVAEGIRIRADTGTESMSWVKKKRFLGKISTIPRDAKAVADEAEDHTSKRGEVLFWMERSSIDSGRTETGVAWRHQQAWKTQKVHMSTNKEVFDRELYAFAQALKVFLKEGQARSRRAFQEGAFPWSKAHIWTDSQVAIANQQHTALRLGQ